MAILPEGHFSASRKARLAEKVPGTYLFKSSYGTSSGEQGYRARLAISVGYSSSTAINILGNGYSTKRRIDKYQL